MKKFFFAVTLCAALAQAQNRPPANADPYANNAAAGTTQEATDAYWLGTAQSGMSGIMLARALGLEGKPVTRVENYCATGSEALRQAAYAVASGAYDSAMAIGVEKVKDSGYQGLNAFPIPTDGTNRTLTAAAMFSMVAPAYAQKYGVPITARTKYNDPVTNKPPTLNIYNVVREEGQQAGRTVSALTALSLPHMVCYFLRRLL